MFSQLESDLLHKWAGGERSRRWRDKLSVSWGKMAIAIPTLCHAGSGCLVMRGLQALHRRNKGRPNRAFRRALPRRVINMEVITNSERVLDYRRKILELSLPNVITYVPFASRMVIAISKR